MFLSYSRSDESLAANVATDLTGIGIDVWRDEKLSGGQAWWDTILESIRRADAVVFVLSAGSLQSVPCRREIEYAQALGKPILPVRIDKTSPGLAPPFLASLEWVDYSVEAREAVIRLMRAVNALPEATELPDPLPDPPEVPLSYTTNLAALVNQQGDLTAQEQHSLVFELREGLQDATHREECAQLLHQLSARRDLLANVAREVDEALKRYQSSREASDWPAPSGKPQGQIPVPPPDPGGHRWRVVLAFVAGLLVLPALIIAAVMGMDPAESDEGGAVIGPPTAPREDDAGPPSEDANPTPEPTREPTPEPPPPPQTYGDDADLDLLWDECSSGTFTSCDDLLVEAESGTDYSDHALTCGGRVEDGEVLLCSTLPFPYTSGDDEELDVLQDGCLAGHLVACDDLWADSPADSVYDVVGNYCGGLSLEPRYGSCWELADVLTG